MPSRPIIIEKREYIDRLPVEAFIVPLLRRRILHHLDTVLGNAREFRVLDAGCGGQPFRAAIEARGCRYVSMDAQDPLGIVDHIALLDGDLPDLLLAQGPFDFILCTEVLEHVADWRKAFENLRLLARSGAKVLLTCPHIYVLHEVPFDFWRPTDNAIRYFADAFGFRCIEIEQAGTSWDVLGTVYGANLKSAVAIERTFLNRVLAFAVDRIVSWLFAVLKNGFIQRRIRWGNDNLKLYLSNVALIERL